MILVHYCKLCRAKELELFNDILSKAGAKHTRACQEAGCKHVPHSTIRLPKKVKK